MANHLKSFTNSRLSSFQAQFDSLQPKSNDYIDVKSTLRRKLQTYVTNAWEYVSYHLNLMLPRWQILRCCPGGCRQLPARISQKILGAWSWNFGMWAIGIKLVQYKCFFCHIVLCFLSRVQSVWKNVIFPCPSDLQLWKTPKIPQKLHKCALICCYQPKVRFLFIKSVGCTQ